MMNSEKEELLHVGRFSEKPFSSQESKSKYCISKSPLRAIRRFLSSGILLKSLSLAIGLWNPRRRCRALCVLIFLVADATLLLQGCVCLSTSSPLKEWFCFNFTAARNYTTLYTGAGSGLSLSQELFHIEDDGLQLAYLVNCVLSISHIMSQSFFFWSIIVLPKREGALGQDKAYSLLKPSDWLKLNIRLIIFACALLSSFISMIWFENNYRYSHGVIIPLSFGFYAISLWTSLMTCWLFSTVTRALEYHVANFCHDIKSSTHCSLDDLIRMHRELCKEIISTSSAFKLWFIVHWISYAITTTFWFASIAAYFSNLSKSWCSVYYELLVLALYLYVFVYPCYCAARLTEKCQQIIVDFNMMTDDDWHSTHPFHHRSQLNLFLQYANYANCGYRVGNITFSSMYLLFSTLLGLLSFVLKLL